MLVKSEVISQVRQAAMTDISVPTMPPSPTSETAMKRPAQKRDTGVPALQEPTETGLIPSHISDNVLATGKPRRREGPITQVWETPAVIFNDAPGNGSTGNGSAQERTHQFSADYQGEQAGSPLTEIKGAGTPPPREPGADATGENDRERKIREILERNQAALAQWQEEHDGIPTFPTRENMDALKGLFITRRILELAEDPEAVDVKLDHGSNADELRIFVTEKHTAPVSDPDLLAYWAEENILSDQADPMQLQYYDAIQNGTLAVTDFIFLHTTISKFGANDDADIFIKSLQIHPDKQRKGIGKANEKNVENFGAKQGYKYVVGENEALARKEPADMNCHDIFVQKFGRIPYAALTSDVQQRMSDRYTDELAFGNITFLTVYEVPQSKKNPTEKVRKPGDEEARMKQAAEDSLHTFMEGDEQTRTEAAVKIAEMLTSDADIEPILDRLSLTDQQKARELAVILKDWLENRFNEVNIYSLAWIKANLPAFTEATALETALADQVIDKRYANALLAASRWAEADNKTIARIEELADTMDAFEKGVLSQLDTLPLRKILLRNAKPDPKYPERKRNISERTLRNISVEPVIAQSVINPDRTEGAKLAFQSNARAAGITGRPEISFVGDGPMGFIFSYRGVPQGFVSFDIDGSKIFIRQMQGARKYNEVGTPTGFMKEIEQSPGALQDIDFPGAAIDLVANICHSLGLPSKEKGVPVVQVISGHNIAEANPDADTQDPDTLNLDQAIKIYDDTANRKLFFPDPTGNWIIPLNNLLME